MEIDCELTCRLCLKSIKADYGVIEETHLQMINFVIGNMHPVVIPNSLMCNECGEMLQKCYDFKTACLHLKDNRPMFFIVPADYHLKLCNCCGGLAEPLLLISLNSTQSEAEMIKSMIAQHFSELDLLSLLDPVICVICYNFLQQHFDFIKKVLNVEKLLENKKNETESFIVQNAKDEIQQGSESVDLGDDHRKMDHIKSEINVPDESEKNSMENVLKFAVVKMENVDEHQTYISKASEISSVIKYEDIKVEKIDVDDKLIVEEDDIVKVEKVDCNETTAKSVSSKHVNMAEEFGTVKVKTNGTMTQIDNKFDRGIEMVVKNYHKSGNKGLVKKGNNNSRDNIMKAEVENRTYDMFDTIHNAIETVIKKNCADHDGITTEEECKPIKKELDGIKQKKKQKKGFRPRAAPSECFPKAVLRTKIKRVNLSGQKMYECDICHVRIRAKCSMNRHMKIHQDPSELIFFYCYNCSFKAKSKSTLANHVLLHTEIYPHKCERCEFRTQHRNNLRLHMKQCGAEYKCVHCPFKTSRKCYLSVHMRKHIKPNVISCKHCNFRTKYMPTIRKHMRKIHGIKFASCSTQTEVT